LAELVDGGSAEAVSRVALAEIAPEGTVGALITTTAAEDGVLALNFVSTLSGYPGWHWSVSVAELPGEQPTVLEVELMPGEGALLSPDWVPWVDRLEEYHVAQAALVAEAGGAAGPDGLIDDEDDLVDELDYDDDLDDDDVDLDDEIDFEGPLGLPTSGVDEEDEAESEPDDDGPEQPDQS